MAGYWVQVIVALLAGVLGAAVVVRVRRRASVRDVRADADGADPDEPLGGPGADGAPGTRGSGRAREFVLVRDPWLCAQNRCEQAVCRAARAVDTVSSEHARRSLRRLVHRMDAELPYVRALVELGRGFEPVTTSDDRARGTVPGRVHEQLTDAAARFEAMTDDLARSVSELVADADLDRVRSRTAVLRDRFPLVASMSELLEQPHRADAATSGFDTDLASATR